MRTFQAWFLVPCAGLFACNSAPASEAASGSFAAGSVTCTPEQQQKALAPVLNTPITSLRSYAGLDLTGGDRWPLLTLDDVERGLCQPTVTQETESPLEYAFWGGDSPFTASVVVSYFKATHRIWTLDFRNG